MNAETKIILPIEWDKGLQPVGDEPDPEAYLLGTVSIMGSNFHVEAFAVHYSGEDETGEQLPDECTNTAQYELLAQMVEGACTPIYIKGRPYAVSIIPFQW